MLVTFSQAASHLGHRSRSTLYRLRADGRLREPYLVRGAGDHGADLIELTPPGRPSFRQWIEGGVLGSQGPLEARLRRARPTAPEVPVTPAEADGAPWLGGTFWAEYGRFDPSEPPLEVEDSLRQALRMAAALMNVHPAEGCARDEEEWFEDFGDTFLECLRDTAEGARWDSGQWYRNSVLTALAEAGHCRLSREELRGYLIDGKVPDDLFPVVREALETHPLEVTNEVTKLQE